MISWVIFEMQTDRDGNTAFVSPVNEKDEAEAWSKYYLTLSYAVKSLVYCHTVMICTTDGRTLESKCYMHGINPEPEPEINEGE